MNRPFAASLRQLWLVLIGSALLLSSAQAVERYRLPSAKKKNAPLQRETSLSEHRLQQYRAPAVSPFRSGKDAYSTRYTRRKKGSQRVSRR